MMDSPASLDAADGLLLITALVVVSWCLCAWWLLPHPLSTSLILFTVLSVGLPSCALGAWLRVHQRRKATAVQAIAEQLPHYLLDTLTPIPEVDTLPEQRAMIVSLNRIIARLRDIYQNERDFSAHASHELRTPLSGIKLQAELALRSGDDKSRTKALKHVLRSVDRCTHLVEQLLTLSRLAPSKIEGHVQPVSVVRIAQMVMATIATRAQEQSIQLTLKPESMGKALVHKDSIAILLSNLLRNAVLHTPPGSAVEVSVFDAGNQQVCLRVRDNGPGLQVADHTRVLQRLAKHSKPDQSGTGLGLAIVKRIADLHGGEVKLSSPDSGTGLIVDVLLPAAPHAGNEHETDELWELPAHAVVELA